MEKNLSLTILLLLFIPAFLPSPAFCSQTPDAVVANPPIEGDPSPFAHYHPRVAVIFEMRGLLLQRDYQRLNERLDAIQKTAEADFRREDDALDAFRAFRVNVKGYKTLLDEWAALYPNDYQPYLARAFYNNKLGWEARGTGWASKTTDMQMREMGDYFNYAVRDAETALTVNPKLIPAYWLLLNVARTNAMPARDALDRALKVSPHSFIARMSYIFTLTKRWGGSYGEQEAFALEAQAYADRNPLIAVLQGYRYWDMGKDAYTAKSEYQESVRKFFSSIPLVGKYLSFLSFFVNKRIGTYYRQKQIGFYTKALSFGDFALFRSERADAYYWEAKYDGALYAKALDDIRRAVELDTEAYYYAIMAKVLYETGEYREAAQSIALAVALDHNDSDVINGRKWLAGSFVHKGHQSFEKKDFEKAVEFYGYAIAADAKNDKAYYWRGRAVFETSVYASALADFKKSAELAPSEFNTWEWIDWTYAKMNDFDGAIEAWGKFIDANPTNDRAYLLRSWAYYCRGNLTAALDDAGRSMELGNKAAVERYEMIRRKMTTR